MQHNFIFSQCEVQRIDLKYYEIDRAGHVPDICHMGSHQQNNNNV